MDSKLFQLKGSTFRETYRWVLITGDFYQHISSICGTGFLGIPHEQFNLDHWSYLFKIWTQEQFRDLTTEKVIEERLAFFQI